MVLIFGDEVEALGPEENERAKVTFRRREGWIEKDHLGNEAVLEAYFIDVGQGDSTFIVTPGRKIILVDGGINDRALRFLAWKYRLSDLDQNSPLIINLLVMTHADDDHIGGLIPIISHPKIQVKRIVHSGLATFKAGVFNEALGDIVMRNGEKYLATSHDGLADLSDADLSDMFLAWKKAIENKGHIAYGAINSSTLPLDLGDPRVTLEVLGPRAEQMPDGTVMYRWFDDLPHTINGHSVVLRLTCGKVSFLLSGDLNIQGSKNLLEEPNIASMMDAHVLKAPHHGSHEYHQPWLDAVNPQISIISSGDDPDHGHPRANFVAAAGQSSRSKKPLVFSTEIAATFKEGGQKLEKEFELSEEERSSLDDSTLAILRLLFKRRLHGMINVRTDGKKIHAARRVAAGYWWESYGPIAPASRSK
jgi:beta-lactamase superfamily II metal-dependent hydrolase